MLYEEILEAATRLGRLMADTEEIKSYNAAVEAYNKDLELIELLENYNAICTCMAELPEDDKDARGRFAKDVMEIRGRIMQNPSMQNYKEAKDRADKLQNDVMNQITFGMTGEMPCSGDCSKCGGCH